VTATGLNAVAGLLWKKPKPFASSAGIRLRRLTSLASITRRMPSSAASAETPIAMSPVMTATSASKSMPNAFVGADDVVARADQVAAVALVHQRVGVEARRHLGVARAPDQLDMVDERRAVGPLVGARQRRHAARRLECERMARAPVVQRLRQLLELRRMKVPVVEHLLQTRRGRAGIVGMPEVARDDDELTVARTVAVGGEFHGGCGVGKRILSRVPLQPTGPAGRPPARRRAGAIAALTGVAVLLHAALLSEVRWTWPAPPAPFGAMQVRALTATSGAGPGTGSETAGRPLDVEGRIEATSLAAARDGEGRVPSTVRPAAAHPADQTLRSTAATRPLVPATRMERIDRGGQTGRNLVPEIAVASPSHRDGRVDAVMPNGSATGSAASDSLAASMAADVARAEALMPHPAAPTQPLATAWPEPDSIPLYRTHLPPSATLRFAMRASGAAGTAELRWRPDGEAYELRLEGSVEGGPTLTQASDGGFDVAGLAPVRHTDARSRRGMLATNFQRDAGRISFSGSRAQVALARGSQDRLSWMVQLAAVLAAEPALRLPGAVVSIPVAGLRGEAAVWRFRTVEPEAPGTAPGAAAAGPPRARPPGAVRRRHRGRARSGPPLPAGDAEPAHRERLAGARAGSARGGRRAVARPGHLAIGLRQPHVGFRRTFHADALQLRQLRVVLFEVGSDAASADAMPPFRPSRSGAATRSSTSSPARRPSFPGRWPRPFAPASTR
jgi:hypothetical protein